LAFLVVVQNTETGKVETIGAYDAPPIIIAPDGSQFYSARVLGRENLGKPQS